MSALLDWKYINFAHPYFLGLLLLIPFMIWWQLRKKKGDQPAMRLTTLSGMAKAKPSAKVRLRPVLFILRIIAFTALIVALARPQSSNVTESIDSEGIDIVLSIDVSGSMLAEDLRPNRIEAAKKVAIDFVDQRPTDRIGLVVFAGESFTQCPITIDHNVLKEQISNIKSGVLVDGTAIGMGLATGVDRLRNATGKSRVLILLTDGVNNTGLIDPSTALEIAKAYKVRIYTIGVGTQGNAAYPVQTPMGMQKQMMPVQIDEPLMRKIAGETGGKYFRATNNKSLAAIYTEINQLEKTRIDISTYKHYAELFFPFALIAIICLVLELALRYTYFRTIT
ncbi:vWA domain-containing protein [Polluticoccus soli]|uniref:vWA domain-containing protein n=1 Tax=Polluticoccus soli TaxID=3034150 RepID=UPI0023E31E9A|nr:VWA domain-containing protein [Flavipsychrobacter sp. JY13-12]